MIDFLIKQGYGLWTLGRGLGVMYGGNRANCAMGWLYVPDSVTDPSIFKGLVEDYKNQVGLK